MSRGLLKHIRSVRKSVMVVKDDSDEIRRLKETVWSQEKEYWVVRLAKTA
jgi:hypothetical protein